MNASDVINATVSSAGSTIVADQSLMYLLGIAIVLVGGIILTIIANKLRVSNILSLLVFGLGLGIIPKKYQVFSFDKSFLIALAILTLVMIVFDGTSRFKIKDVDALSGIGAKLVLYFLVANIILSTSFVLFSFKSSESLFASIMYALIFSIIMCGTDPGSVFVLLKNAKSKVIELLKIEAILNTPLMVLLPFLLIDVLNTVSGSQGAVFDLLVKYLPEILLQIVAGLGMGIFVGLVAIKLMRRFYSEELSPIALMGAAILAYVLAEGVGGNGVLAVATLGVAYGNTYVREKASLQEFSSHLSLSLELLVYVLIGVAVQSTIPWGDLWFWLKAILLFLVLFIARLIAIMLTLRKQEGYSPRELLFIAANMPKGIAVAVVVFSFLATDPAPYLANLLSLTVVFMIFSLLIASIIDRFGDYFLTQEKEEKKDLEKESPEIAQ